jgi:putative transposase
MRDGQSQSHVRWDCKYHMVFVPKYRRRVIYGQLRRSIGRSMRELGQHQGVERVEGHARPEHVHLCLSIPPKYSVANPVGWLTGKSAVRMHRACVGRERHVTGLPCWARGYCVSTVRLDEPVMREYIRNQEQEEKRQEELQLKGLEPLS